MGFRRMIYVGNHNISKIEQNWAKKGLSHTWIGADVDGCPNVFSGL